jgi:hypothetical protein
MPEVRSRNNALYAHLRRLPGLRKIERDVVNSVAI